MLNSDRNNRIVITMDMKENIKYIERKKGFNSTTYLKFFDL